MVSIAEIEELITDKSFQELKFRQEKTNMFTVVGQTHTEHWHSSFWAWLLDPHSSLRLGHFPLARFITMYMVKDEKRGLDLRDLYKWNLDAVKFCTEKSAPINGHKRSIDVYGESDELIIVIENKVNAKENYNNSDVGQTQDYYDYVEQNKKPGQTVLYFFLTADSKQKCYSDKYVRVSYQEMYDNIIGKCIDHPQVSDDGKYLLEQYASNLRETIKNSNTPMALANISLCKDIYEAHPQVLDHIFDTVANSMDFQSSGRNECVAYAHYQSVFDEIYLSVDEKFGETPNSRLVSQNVTITELYQDGLITDGMEFTMKYDGNQYFAKSVVSSDLKKCYMVILDENKKPFLDSRGEVIGVYESPTRAGVDVINLYYEKNKIDKKINTLRGASFWLDEKGRSIKEMLNDKNK